MSLETLRKHIISKWEYFIRKDEIVFTNKRKHDTAKVKEIVYPKTSPTTFLAKSSKKYYDLSAVYHCVLYQSLSFGEYVKKCRKNGAKMVSTVDKKELLAYLKGEISKSSQVVDPSTVDEKAVASLKRKKVAGGNEKVAASSDSKRVRTAGKSSAETNAREMDPVVQRVKEVIVGREIVRLDRENVACLTSREFTCFLVLLDEHKKLQKLNSSQPTKLSKINKKDMPLHKMIAKLRGPPIIVCSAGSLDVFNMLNVYDFLQYERYIPVQTKKAEKKTKQRSFIIQQQVDGNMLEFQVVDSVRRFTAADWSRVVAVLVSGQSWQFKGWKWQFPVQLFNKVLGVHVYLQGSELKPDVQSWKVKMLPIHADKRHLDIAASRQFWQLVFNFMKVKFGK